MRKLMTSPGRNSCFQVSCFSARESLSERFLTRRHFASRDHGKCNEAAVSFSIRLPPALPRLPRPSCFPCPAGDDGAPRWTRYALKAKQFRLCCFLPDCGETQTRSTYYRFPSPPGIPLALSRGPADSALCAEGGEEGLFSDRWRALCRISL